MSEPRVLPIYPPYPVPPGGAFAEAVDALNERIMGALGVPAELCRPPQEKPMTVADAFLADILAHPEDDAPRLIFADWCEDNGQPERAEFIRVQVELASLPAFRGGDAGRRHRALARREGVAWGNVWPEVLRPLPFMHCGLPVVDERQAGRLVCGQGPSSVEWRWRRGFVEWVCLPCAEWERYGPALVRAAPLGRVELSDRQPWNNTLLGDGGHEWAWMGGGGRRPRNARRGRPAA